MVADQGPDPSDDEESSTHDKRTPQKLHTPKSSSEEPKIKIESPVPAAARRHDSPLPRSPLQRTRRNEVDMHGSRPGVATSQNMGTIQQMSLDELISLRRAERDTTNELAKAQRRLERLSHRMGWSPETKRTIEQLASKQHAARGDAARGAAREAREREPEHHESSDDSDDGSSSSSEDDSRDGTEEPEQQTPIDDEIEEAYAKIRAMRMQKAPQPPKTRPAATKDAPTPTPTTVPKTLERLKPLSDAEIKRLSFEPTRESISTDYVDALTHLAQKHAALAEWRALLGKSQDEIDKALSTRADLETADRYAHGALTQLVSKGSESGKLFANEERKLARAATSTTSTGAALARRIANFGAAKTLTEAKQRFEDEGKKSRLSAGDRVEVTKLKIDRLIDLHEDLPQRLKAAIDPQQVIMDAIPDSITEDAQRSYKQRLQDQMDEHLETHGEPQYDITTLRNVIAKRLSTARASDIASHAFVATGGDGKKGGAGDDGGKRAKAFDGKRAKGTIGEVKTGRGMPASDGKPAREGSRFCFITDTSMGGDIFFHLSDAHDRVTDFEEGDSVDFKITYDARKGKDRAVDVKLIESAAVASAGGDEEYDASTMW